MGGGEDADARWEWLQQQVAILTANQAMMYGELQHLSTKTRDMSVIVKKVPTHARCTHTHTRIHLPLHQAVTKQFEYSVVREAFLAFLCKRFLAEYDQSFEARIPIVAAARDPSSMTWGHQAAEVTEPLTGWPVSLLTFFVLTTVLFMATSYPFSHHNQHTHTHQPARSRAWPY
jgi:hypothetical protein